LNQEILAPTIPFIWFDQRIHEGIRQHAARGPLFSYLESSDQIFGLLEGLNDNGIDIIESLVTERQLKCMIIISVYAACDTRQNHLKRLAELQSNRDSVSFRILTSDVWGGSKSSILYCKGPSHPDGLFMIGPSSNLGLVKKDLAQVNFVFRANSSLFTKWYNWFEWLWSKHAAPLNAETTEIPELVPAKGTEEAVRMWSEYIAEVMLASLSGDAQVKPEVTVDPDTGHVVVKNEDDETVQPIKEGLNIQKPDPFVEQIGSIFEKGDMVTINKFSRLPPLDMPIKAEWFGVESLRRQGAVSREVKYRISVIEQKTLRKLENKRKEIRQLLNKLSYPLADSVRWIPHPVKSLLQKEMERVNQEGQNLLKSEIGIDVKGFVEDQRSLIEKDINQMYQDFHPGKQINPKVIKQIINDLIDRLQNVMASQFIPEITYTPVNFSDNSDLKFNSPWTQAFLLLYSVAEFPRKVATDTYFLRGLRIDKDDLLKAMDVCKDRIIELYKKHRVEDLSKKELDYLITIKNTDVEDIKKCKAIYSLIEGKEWQNIEKDLKTVDKSNQLPLFSGTDMH
jgi:hypothetical protein